MADKEIIIDGVDVSECEKLGETIGGITCGLGKRIRFANEIITKHNLCEDNPNCYYKQLKRLEFENKLLKADYEASEQENAELKAENERLKEENRYYKAELKLNCNELDKSEKWQVSERRKKNEYYTALKEIEKLFKKEYTRPVFRNCFDEYPKECKRCLHDGSCLQQQVLNIINSTKAEEE